jgi:hypothetical protein
MSHTLDFTTNVMDQDCLVLALKRMGVPESSIQVHEKATLMATFHPEERKHAHVIVKRKVFKGRFNSDIGWEKNDEGLFVGHIDEFAYNGSPHYGKEWQAKLYTYYNVEVTKKAFTQQGMEIIETKNEKNQIVIRAKYKAAPVQANKIKIRAIQ